jgi:hypothetical protein
MVWKYCRVYKKKNIQLIIIQTIIRSSSIIEIIIGVPSEGGHIFLYLQKSTRSIYVDHIFY